MSSITLNADKLRKKSHSKLAMNKSIRTHILNINSEISNAYYAGQDSIIHPVESYFGIPDIDNSYVQTYVYSSIIRELTDKNFAVSLKNKNNLWYFFISWKPDNDEYDTIRRQEIIEIAKRKN